MACAVSEIASNHSFSVSCCRCRTASTRFPHCDARRQQNKKAGRDLAECLNEWTVRCLNFGRTKPEDRRRRERLSHLITRIAPPLPQPRLQPALFSPSLPHCSHTQPSLRLLFWISPEACILPLLTTLTATGRLVVARLPPQSLIRRLPSGATRAALRSLVSFALTSHERSLRQCTRASLALHRDASLPRLTWSLPARLHLPDLSLIRSDKTPYTRPRFFFLLPLVLLSVLPLSPVPLPSGRTT